MRQNFELQMFRQKTYLLKCCWICWAKHRKSQPHTHTHTPIHFIHCLLAKIISPWMRESGNLGMMKSQRVLLVCRCLFIYVLEETSQEQTHLWPAKNAYQNRGNFWEKGPIILTGYSIYLSLSLSFNRSLSFSFFFLIHRRAKKAISTQFTLLRKHTSIKWTVAAKRYEERKLNAMTVHWMTHNWCMYNNRQQTNVVLMLGNKAKRSFVSRLFLLQATLAASVLWGCRCLCFRAQFNTTNRAAYSVYP